MYVLFSEQATTRLYLSCHPFHYWGFVCFVVFAFLLCSAESL